MITNEDPRGNLPEHEQASFKALSLGMTGLTNSEVLSLLLCDKQGSVQALEASDKILSAAN
ncbi:hypothetical protein ACYSNX_08705 [Myroides sp. LJL115]